MTAGFSIGLWSNAYRGILQPVYILQKQSSEYARARNMH